MEADVVAPVVGVGVVISLYVEAIAGVEVEVEVQGGVSRGFC